MNKSEQIESIKRLIEQTKAEQIKAIKRLIENIETYLPYADGSAYYNDLERLRELRAELEELEENEE